MSKQDIAYGLRLKKFLKLRSLSMPGHADPLIFNNMTNHMIEQLQKGILYSPSGYTSQINHKSAKRKYVPLCDQRKSVISTQAHSWKTKQ